MGRFIKNFSIANTGTSVALPSGPTASQPVDATAGSLRYNTTLNSFEFYNGTNWVQVTGAVGGKHTVTRDSFTLDGSTTAYTPLSFEPSADQNVSGVHRWDIPERFTVQHLGHDHNTDFHTRG
jgi:hypothetical protein